MKKKVILGLSGGVDSSVCIKLLKDKNYDVEAMFMRNWDSALNNDILGNPTINSDQCPQEKDYNDAKQVSIQQNIKLHRIDFVKEYWDNVFQYFLDEYKKMRTPNPDLMCNKYIKFDAFLKEAIKLNADYIAMGHYARVKHYKDYSILLKGKDENKDQSYFLAFIPQKALQKTLFPLGDLTKEEVREIAKQEKLITAEKKDSTGICFIGERNFKEFLKNYLPANKGDIINIKDKEKLSEHEGLMYYTIGQRKGLGIGGNNKYENQRWFVVGKDLKNNYLLVTNEDDKLLKSNRLIATNLNWIYKEPEKTKYTAKFRYRQKDINIEIIKLENDKLEIKYKDTKAVTPGQAVVIYDKDICLGGGIIDEVYYNNEKRVYINIDENNR